MKHFRQGHMLLGCIPVLFLLSGCGEAGPECDSANARNSVVKIISDNSHNALVSFAADNSSAVASMASDAKTEAEKSAISEKARQRASYKLDDTIRMNSRNKAKRLVTCTGLLSVTVEDATAQKEVEFKVEQTADGKTSVSVSPFQF
jgi:flagellar basal body-associated protein FliL